MYTQNGCIQRKLFLKMDVSRENFSSKWLHPEKTFLQNKCIKQNCTSSSPFILQNSEKCLSSCHKASLLIWFSLKSDNIPVKVKSELWIKRHRSVKWSLSCFCLDYRRSHPSVGQLQLTLALVILHSFLVAHSVVLDKLALPLWWAGPQQVCCHGIGLGRKLIPRYPTTPYFCTCLARFTQKNCNSHVRFFFLFCKEGSHRLARTCAKEGAQEDFCKHHGNCHLLWKDDPKHCVKIHEQVGHSKLGEGNREMKIGVNGGFL